MYKNRVESLREVSDYMENVQENIVNITSERNSLENYNVTNI